MIPLWTTYAGLIVAPSAWAISTQLGQMLPYVDCQHRLSWSAFVTATAVACALGSAWISWKGAQRTEPAALTFASRLSVLTALVIAFAIFLQGTASLLVDPCAR